MNTLKNIRNCIIVALGLTAANTAVAQQIDFPIKPVKLIVPFEVGGPADVLSRILADTLGAKLRTTVIVENRGGAGGAIGSEAVAKADPDGYTIGVATISTHVVNPSCNPNLRYDPIKSFTPVALVGSMPNILVVGESLRLTEFQQFRSLLEKNSEKYNLGTAGPCSFGHLMLEHLNDELDSQIVHVPYRGSGPAVTDLIGGALDMMMDTYPLLNAHIKSGKLSPLAVAWTERLQELPNVPTFAELDLPEMSTTSWYGIVGPAGIPSDRLNVLSEKVMESLQDSELQQRFASAYIYAAQENSPENFKHFLKEQFRKESAFISERKMGSN